MSWHNRTGALLLCALCAATAAIEAQSVVQKRSPAVDDRVRAEPLGSCVYAPPSTKTAVRDSDELDAAHTRAGDYVLRRSELVVSAGGRSTTYPLGQPIAVGKLLYVSPTRVLYFGTVDNVTRFFIVSPQAERMFFAAGADFVDAAVVATGDVALATATSLVIVSVSNKIVPVLQVDPSSPIVDVAVRDTDDSLLVTTKRNLVKVIRSGRAYQILSGEGGVNITPTGVEWCAGSGERYRLDGLDRVGVPSEDREYAIRLSHAIERAIRDGATSDAAVLVGKLREIVGDNQLLADLRARLQNATSAVK